MFVKPLLNDWNFMFRGKDVTTEQRNEIIMQFLNLVEDEKQTSFSPDYNFIIRGRVFGHKNQNIFPDRAELFSSSIIKIIKVLPDPEDFWVGKHTRKEKFEAELPFYVITSNGEKYMFFMSGQHSLMVKMMEDAKNGTLSLEPRAYLPKQNLFLKEWI